MPQAQAESDDRSRRSRAERRRKSHDYGQAWMLAAALLDGPLTLEDLEDHYRVLGRRFGVHFDLFDRAAHSRESALRRNILETLDVVLTEEWAVERDGRYQLTESGREEAHRMLRDLETGGRRLERATRPETVSLVTLFVHLALAAVKLPAAVLSGSVGLLNDSLDTLMDGISSLFVYAGVRTGRERLASYILLAFMALTGGFTLFEAASRLLWPEPLRADWFTFAAVAFSGAVCALLWAYQKYAGIKHACVPLIAQAIDSRNHVLVAVGVGGGLVAAAFRAPIIDGLVGLAVAVLIFKGAAELLADVVRTAGDEEIDLSKYGFTRLARHGHRQTVRWLLYEVARGGIHTKDELRKRAAVGTDFRAVQTLNALGLADQEGRAERLERAVHEVFDRELVRELAESEKATSSLHLTERGKAELDRALSASWGLGGSPEPSGLRGSAVRGLGFAARFAVSAVLFGGLYAGVRWLLGGLPTLDVWGVETLAQPFGPRPVVAMGPFTLTAAQVACAATGLAVFHIGRVLLHKAKHAPEADGEPEDPATRPPRAALRVRRQPLTGALILLNIGAGIGLHSLYTLVWAVVATVFQLGAARVEERRLAQWFGEEYHAYRDSVTQRFLPAWGWLIVGGVFLAALAGIPELW